MTVELRWGNLTFRVAASGTCAPDRASFVIGESVCTAAAIGAQESQRPAMDPFDAVRHEHRITNHPSVLKEEDSPIASAAARSGLPRYYGTHGRLLSFKNKR